MRDADLVWIFLTGLSAGIWLAQAVRPEPRTIVIPENEPINARFLARWKGTEPWQDEGAKARGTAG
ncbi:MAG: hypothetical protein ACREHV_11790 [Rhizomicrobium sp.]